MDSHDLRNLSPGVLLLNSVLTVKANTANSHAVIGWNQVTNAILQILDTERKGIVFLLWGKYARVCAFVKNAMTNCFWHPHLNFINLLIILYHCPHMIGL